MRFATIALLAASVSAVNSFGFGLRRRSPSRSGYGETIRRGPTGPLGGSLPGELGGNLHRIRGIGRPFGARAGLEASTRHDSSTLHAKKPSHSEHPLSGVQSRLSGFGSRRRGRHYGYGRKFDHGKAQSRHADLDHDTAYGRRDSPRRSRYGIGSLSGITGPDFNGLDSGYTGLRKPNGLSRPNFSFRKGDLEIGDGFGVSAPFGIGRPAFDIDDSPSKFGGPGHGFGPHGLKKPSFASLSELGGIGGPPGFAGPDLTGVTGPEFSGFGAPGY